MMKLSFRIVFTEIIKEYIWNRDYHLRKNSEGYLICLDYSYFRRREQGIYILYRR